MRIGGIQKTSMIDFPGYVSAVVFTQGCEWRCAYCHNPSLVVPREYSETVSETQVLRFLKRRVGRLKGVVISGGEPTLQSDLTEFIQKVRELGYAVKLDTNGSNPGLLRELIRDDMVDYIAMDVKAPLDSYQMVTCSRASKEDIRSSIWLLKSSGIDYEFRTTAVPGLHTLKELKAIADLLRGADRYVIQPFRSGTTLHPALRDRGSFPTRQLKTHAQYFKKRVKEFVVLEPDDTEASLPLAEAV